MLRCLLLLQLYFGFKFNFLTADGSDLNNKIMLVHSLSFNKRSYFRVIKVLMVKTRMKEITLQKTGKIELLRELHWYINDMDH